MAKQTNDRLVHHYDVERHEVLCGTRTPEDHSTKHRHGITCPDCAELLRKEGVAGASAPAESDAGV